MILEHTKLLLKLYYRPLKAMSAIIDEGNWSYGALAVAAISLVLQFAVTTHIYGSYESVPVPIEQQVQSGDQESRTDDGAYGDEYYYAKEPLTMKKPLPLVGGFGWYIFSFSPFSILTTAIALALFYVPVTILLMSLVERQGSFSVALRREYGPLLSCTFMAWAAAHLPFVLAGLALDTLHLGALSALALWVAAKTAFAVFMICALRTVFGTSFGKATSVTCLSWISAPIEMFLLGSHLLWYLASPCIFYLVYSFFRGNLGDLSLAYRSRQSFRHNLEMATINPCDSEAHYQLGLIYQHRRQYTVAIARFKRAIEINSRETDAHFQLGRIAREQGRLQEALDYFGEVVTQDDKYSHSEVWREIGATYVAASMYHDAQAALERYIERRPFDPEGLYLFATALEKLSHTERAREMFEQCIQAVKTMPYYRRGQARKWGRLAAKQLREMCAEAVQV